MKEWKDELKSDPDLTNVETSAINGGQEPPPVVISEVSKELEDLQLNHTGETNNNDMTSTSSLEEKASTGNKKPGSGGKVGSLRTG